MYLRKITIAKLTYVCALLIFLSCTDTANLQKVLDRTKLATEYYDTDAQ